MRHITAFLTSIALIAGLASSALAYEIALKNGKVIRLQKCRATETQLSCLDENGGETSLVLSDIDLEQTRELNASANPPLDIPALRNPRSQDASDSQPSLGELARKLRKDKPDTPRRIYTTDDLHAATFEALDEPTSGKSEPDAWRQKLDTVRSQVAAFENMSVVSLSRWALGELDVDFPGRNQWQKQLFEKKQSVDDLIHTAEAAFEKYQQIREALKPVTVRTLGEEERLEQSRKDLEKSVDRVRIAGYELGSMISDGKQRAKAWKGR